MISKDVDFYTVAAGYVCWDKAHPEMFFSPCFVWKNEAVEWNYQKNHQFLGSQRNGAKYKKSLQIILSPSVP